MSRMPLDVQAAVPDLVALLWTLSGEQTEIGFDQLCQLCLCAITAAGLEDAEEGTVLSWRPPSEAASVLAAAVVYRSLRRRAQWQVSRDRREPVYAVVDLLHA